MQRSLWKGAIGVGRENVMTVVRHKFRAGPIAHEPAQIAGARA